MTGVKDFDLKPEENIRHDEWIQTGETFTFENIKIDSGYQSLDFLKAVIQGVVVEGKTSLDEISFRPYSIPGLIEESRILFDRTTKAQKLKEQTRPFPDKLKKSLIVEGKTIISESLIDMADYCKRSIGNDAFIFHLWRVTQGFSEILFALNNKYNPMSKRIEKYYENLELKPIDFKERFERILEGPFNQEGRKRTVKEFEVIFQELMEIVNLKMSELHEK
jgi:hypothetical protein